MAYAAAYQSASLSLSFSLDQSTPMALVPQMMSHSKTTGAAVTLVASEVIGESI